jgi:starvation-inducible DNA-binding protein
LNEYVVSTQQGGNSKDDLATQLMCVLSDTVIFKFLAHGYHWNVRGAEFTQFHDFFQEIYEDADSAIDPLAESLRKLGYDAPFLLEDFLSLSCIEARPVGYDPMAMSASLYEANEKVLAYLMDTFDTANNSRQQGVANFLAERIDMHQKWKWQLGTTIGADATVVVPNLM